MTLAATVVVPTHDHGPTLLRSVGSALAQTLEDIEVFVVGDGVPDVTREVMAELTASDERVTFFDNPKGPRHGEVHRHEALQQARGEFVCYLSDDDLWLPGHLDQLRTLLADADFAHTRPVWIDTDGRPHAWLVDLGRPFYRELLLGGENRVPLCCAGHTLELYRSLPAGWRTTPDGIPTDLYMWQQILSMPGCRAASGTRPTVLHFPSPDRKGWSIDERLAELDSWSTRLAESGLESDLSEGMLQTLTADAEALEESLADVRRTLADVDRDRARIHSRLLEVDSRLHEVGEQRASLSQRLDRLDAQLREVDEDRASLSAQLTVISCSRTWRLRGRVIGLLKRVARTRALPAAPAVTDSSRRVETPEPSRPATESPARDRSSDTTARRSGPNTR
jgi:GalNAc5-diNAcBac-PP-undecaprenol beta-1,3-glucosyltransferase